MQVCEQHRVESGQGVALADLEEALRGAAPGVDEEPLSARFHEDRRAEALETGSRIAGAEQRDLQGTRRGRLCADDRRR